MGWMTRAQLDRLGLKFLGEEVLIDNSVMILAPESISIGTHSRIDAGVTISAAGGFVEIGKHVHVASRATIQGGGGVVIDDFSGLSYGVVVISATDDFTLGNLTNPTVPDSTRRVSRKSVRLEKHSIVGANSVITPGVVMGFGSSVGALCKVSRSIPDGGIVVDSSGKVSFKRDLERLKALELTIQCGCSSTSTSTTAGLPGDKNPPAVSHQP